MQFVVHGELILILQMCLDIVYFTETENLLPITKNTVKISWNSIVGPINSIKIKLDSKLILILIFNKFPKTPKYS